MGADNVMAPEASPREIQKTNGVRRVNNIPVYIGTGALGVFVLIMVLVASDRAADQRRPNETPQDTAGNTSMFAHEIAGAHKGGIVAANVRALEVPELPTPQHASPATLRVGGDDLRLEQSRYESPLTSMSQEHLHRIRTAKMQLLEEAIKARTAVSGIAPRSRGFSANTASTAEYPTSREEALSRLAAIRQQIDANTQDDPTSAYKARLRQIQSNGAPGSFSAGPAKGPSLSNSALLVARTSSDGPSFGNPHQEDRWRLDASPQAPRSPYELRAGFVVPATLISGINSDLPGQIMAQVSQDVFDTATGKWKLIPQGARLIGSYSNDVGYGQERVLIAWQRIIFPDGKAMDIGSMPGADMAGYSGFSDQINNHYFRLFGSAFLMSGVTAGVTYSQRQGQTQTTNGAPTASSALSEALGQQLGQVTAQLIAKNMNIAPTLEIRPGYRFNVIVTKDMSFKKPYEAFDY